MDKKTLEARLRQIYALDRNAFDIYSDLSRQAENGDLKRQLAGIAKDEKRHMALSKALISLLGKK